MICLVLQFIQYPLLLISLRVMALPPFAVFSWHHLIKSSVTVPFLHNRIGWVQLLFKLLFLSLPPPCRTWSSSRKGSSEYNLLICLPFATLLFFAELSELISSANALFCAILIIFSPSPQQSQFQQCLKAVLMFQFAVAALFCLFLERLSLATLF